MGAPRHLARALATLATVVALGACEAEAGTQIEVRSATETVISAVVEFRGQAADAVEDQPATAAALEKAFASRVGAIPEHSRDGDTLRYHARLTYPQLVASADVLGVSSAAVAASGKDVALTVVLAQPEGLAEAVRQAVASQPDGASLADTMLATTSVSVRVSFSGGVSSAVFTPTGAAPEALTTSGTTLVLDQPLDTFRPGTLVVTGDPKAPLLSTGRALAVGLVLVATVGLVWRRRR